MKVDEILKDLEKIAKEYFNTWTPNIFNGFGLPYYTQAEWFLKQFANIKNPDLIQKILVLLFSFDFEDNKKEDIFVKTILSAKKSILREWNYSSESIDNGTSDIFEKVHEDSICEAQRAYQYRDGKVEFGLIDNRKEIVPYSQISWISILTEECKNNTHEIFQLYELSDISQYLN